jgi:hypothetical protein
MNNLRWLFAFLMLIFSSSFSILSAQMSISDSLFYQKAVSNVVTGYHTAIADGSALFNGPKYSDWPKFRDGGHAFFNTIIPSNCSIVYDKVFYPNVYLMYDEISGLVIVQDATRRIQLETDKVAEFTIWDNHFVHLKKDSSTTAAMPDGFYQILYESKAHRLLKREEKRVEEDIRSASEGIIRSILTKKLYFIQKKDVYYAVANKDDVLKVFNDRKKEVTQFIKRNKLDFGKDPDAALLKLIAFYDSNILK